MANEQYVRLCKLARIPHEYWFDKKWRHATPRYLKSVLPHHDGHYVRLGEVEQAKWLGKFAHHADLLRQSYFLTFLGDSTPALANRVAFGLLAFAVRAGLTARAFPASACNVPPPSELAQRKADEPARWQVICVYGAHTDDCAERRQAIRDFLQFHDRALRLLVVHGRDPLGYVHLGLGVDPNAIFYLPAEQLRLFRFHSDL
jgi:hypothetical protein